ncbi:MAG TPA: hypothetical protein VHR66_14185 [Gemmataceae bacterium]|nr:hypothetical protein [Gemmataceae bacterium]
MTLPGSATAFVAVELRAFLVKAFPQGDEDLCCSRDRSDADTSSHDLVEHLLVNAVSVSAKGLGYGAKVEHTWVGRHHGQNLSLFGNTTGQ